MEPIKLPLSLLKDITNNFSDDQLIGSGGFANVYKGLLQNGIVAVKKLSNNIDLDEEGFQRELGSLMKVKHMNIIRFLGYCGDTQQEVLTHQGKHILAEERRRLLCFEFLPEGSLRKHITGTFISISILFISSD
ncbi:probable receptor-like protein kinase At5g18500 [Miscanthus floridulus]|uniref:probable receptor-like protein kinase At5g18500 n=1 Tax=Miscanthus floridulus TaxID=154761 RepID=UPI0034576705